MNKFISHGWVDIFRHLNPEQTGAYTWWSNRPTVRERNIGWRIDYFFVSPSIVKRVKRADILPTVTGSDHCPVLLELHT